MSRRLSRTDLARAVYAVAQDGAGTKQVAQAAAAYLIAERRTRELPALMRDLLALQLRLDGVLEVEVDVAHPLSVATRQQLAALFDANRVTIHETLNPDILGGALVRTHDTQLDLTVRGKLQRLRAA